MEKIERLNIKYVGLVVFLLCFGLSINSINNQYTLDDDLVTRLNTDVQKGIGSISSIFNSSFRHGMDDDTPINYRPITLSTYAVEVGLFGNNPLVHHLTNIILYSLLGFIFTLFVYLISENVLYSVLAGILFSVYPLHAEIVASIKNRDELLVGLGVISSLYYIFKYLKGVNNYKYLLFSLIFFLFALLSKENGLSLFVILSLFIVFQKSIKLKIKLTTIGLLVVTLFFYLFLIYVYASGWRELELLDNHLILAKSEAERLLNASYILWLYIVKLIYPYSQSFNYGYNQIELVSWNSFQAYLGVILHLTLFLIAFKRRNDNKVLFVGSIIYLVSIGVYSNLLLNVSDAFAIRFLFLPSFGYIIFVSYLVYKLIELVNNNWQRVGIIAAFICMSISFGYAKIIRNSEWKDNLTLFKADSKKVPNSAKVRRFYGETLSNEATKTNDPVNKRLLVLNAKRELRASVEILPIYHQGWNQLGVLYSHLGELDSAFICYNNGLAVKPDNATLIYNLANVYMKKNKFNQAVKYYKLAIAKKPSLSGAYNNLSATYLHMKDYDMAIFWIQKLLEVEELDKNGYCYHNMGAIYYAKGNYVQSIKFNEIALQKGYRKKQVIEMLAKASYELDDKKRAYKYFNMLENKQFD